MSSEDDCGELIVKEDRGEIIVEEDSSKLNFEEDRGKVIVEEGGSNLNVEEDHGEVIVEEDRGEVIVEEDRGEVIVEEDRGEVIMEENRSTLNVEEDCSEVIVEEDRIEVIVEEDLTSSPQAEPIDRAELLSCGVRRRRSMGDQARTPDLPLNLQVGYRIADGEPDRGTPSPCFGKFIPSTRESTTGASTSLAEFRSKQQSFEIHIEDCDEEEIAIDSEGETEGEGETIPVDRPITPMPVQDFGSVTCTEGPQPLDYLQVKSVYNDCLTDVSDTESDDNEEA